MTKSNSKHIFFVDDERKVCEIIRETLEKSGAIVSCFVHAAECLERLRSQKCDLLIADLKMPEMHGIELVTKVKRLTPRVPVLIITGYGDVPTAVKAIKAGAVDFVEKPLDKKSFVERVQSILGENGNRHDTHSGKPLTRSETRVLKLVIDGKSNKEIASLLKRSKRTIEVHRARVMRKLGVDNLIDLVKRTAAMGLVESQASEEPGEGIFDN
jgi:FixJ family two-component response regulator